MSGHSDSPQDVPRDAEESGKSARLPATVVALGWVSLLTDVASEMIFPLLPRFIDVELKAGKLGLGIIEGIAEAVAALTRLPSGALSDRMARRKPLIFIGYSIAGLVRPLMGFVTAPWQALCVRTVDRFGKGMRGAPRDAMIAGVTSHDSRGRAYGFHRAMDHAGAAVGPLLATVFLWFFPSQMRTLFLLALVPGIAVLVVLWFGVREEPAASSEKSLKARELKWSLAQFPKKFRWFLLSLAVFTLGNSSDAFLLLRAEELGFAVWQLPILWCLYHFAKSVANHFGGRLSDRFDPRKPLIVGWSIYAAVYIGFGWATNVLHAAVLFFAFAIHYGLVEPAQKTLVSRWIVPELRGTAFGWFDLIVGVAAFPASAVFGLIWHSTAWGATGAFCYGAALALIAAILLAVTVREQ